MLGANMDIESDTRRPVVRPPALHPGDTVGIVSPSWFGGEPFLPRLRRGIASLEAAGFKVKVADHALNSLGHVSDTPANRVADLHEMFRDPEIRMVLATIGGDHSCHLLPLIDWSLIRANPKVFMGFSDITVLNIAIHRMTGLVTFNGPALLTDWAEYPEMPTFARSQVMAAITRPEPMGEFAPAPWWTEEFLDWATGEDTSRPRLRLDNPGWTWLREGRAIGPLIGGCLESLQHLRGTPYWPDLDGAILFLETSEVRPTPEDVDALLMDFENMGVLSSIAGLVLARPYGYAPEDIDRLWAIVRKRTAAFGFPVLAGTDTGHTTPLQTLPIGVVSELDAERNRFAILEPAVR
jgi:muramoyltetrapeptide carboxypeptidase